MPSRTWDGTKRPGRSQLLPISSPPTTKGQETSLPERLAPVTTIRPGGHGDDEGGPGDSPASVRWLRSGRGTGYALGDVPGNRTDLPGLVDGRRIDPESGAVAPPDRRVDPPEESM